LSEFTTATVGTVFGMGGAAILLGVLGIVVMKFTNICCIFSYGISSFILTALFTTISVIGLLIYSVDSKQINSFCQGNMVI
jgi:hypothetical protein